MRLKEMIYFYQGSQFNSNLLNSNTIILGGSDKILIDPGLKSNWPELKRHIMEDGINLTDIKLVIFTHCHPDHMDAGSILSNELGVELAMHEHGIDFLGNDGRYIFQWMNLPQPNGDYHPLKEGQFDFGEEKYNLYHTPGHSPGSLSIHWPDKNLLVVGDLYFKDAPGATHLPGGNRKELEKSIRRLQNIADVQVALPGHGPIITNRDNV